MKKCFLMLMLTLCLFVGSTGCSIVTTGDGSWEAYVGVRTKGPAKVEIKSTVVDKIVDSFTDGEISEDE